MTTPSWSTISCETNNGVATVLLNRAEARNLMNMAMREELASCFEALEADANVRVIVITGAGDTFSAGGDMNDFVGRSPEEMHQVMQAKSHKWFRTLWHLTKPTVAAVNGVAAGGATNLILACDFVIASERACFGQTFVKVGLMPDLGGLFLLPRTVGLHRAKALCLTGDLVTAEEAKELGIVYRVVAHEDLRSEAQGLATRLAEGPAAAIAATKRALNRSFELSMEDALHLELYGQSFLFGTTDYLERRDRFLGNGRSDT